MKTCFSRRIGLLITLCLATGSLPLTGQIGPRYVPTQMILVLREDPSASATTGKSPADLFAAMGATGRALTGLQGFYTIELPAGARFGRAYATAQAFDFGPRWSIRNLDPNYIIQVTLDRGPIPENGAVRVFNLSVRADVRTGEGATIAGIVVPGSFAQLVAIRVRGPSLTALGIAQALPNPVLRLYDGPTLVLQNDNWGALRDFEKTMARRACAPPEHSLEAMLVTYLDPGISYTAIVSSAGGETGIAMVETFIVDEFYVGMSSVPL